MASQRFAMLLLASFGAIALLLASIGMYGVISYSVAQRVQEIGVRVALGADRQDILGMVLGQGARLAGLGIAIGLVAAFAATRLMTSFLYGVRPTDPLTFVGVSLLLIGVALLGCYLPARRALRVDPMTALRSEWIDLYYPNGWLTMTTRKTADSKTVTRCRWATTELGIKYHDEEWGVPVRDDRLLFEFLILEGAQAGLSWETILKKRQNYRMAFDNFDPELVAKYGKRKINTLLSNDGIIRNRLKIHAAVGNAQSFLATQEEFGAFDQYIWQFIGGRTKVNDWESSQIPSRSAESDAMSKDLQKRGFKFVGSTICYAFMQAVGMVNDHALDCFRRAQLTRGARKK
jgi:DNA-3-methyladenine glycosylase I